MQNYRYTTFDRADDLRKCLAFDAATACRVFDIARAARETPDAPGIPGIALRACDVRPRAPPNPTIREFTIELARIAGFQASKRQPLPGVMKLWAAWSIFAPQMQLYRTMKAQGMINESTVGN